MPFTQNLFSNNYFPLPPDKKIPFSTILNDVFFQPSDDNKDYPIHGPNVIRYVEYLLANDLVDNGLLAGVKNTQKTTSGLYFTNYKRILGSLLETDDPPVEGADLDKVASLLKVAALFHDIGKVIRRANHPQIGVNLLRSYDEGQSRDLLKYLVYDDEKENTPSKYNRFSLLASIIQHHDKFGVVSTGEGALPIFSDILYFSSNKGAIRGINKNVTSVMLLNLADIAAVCTVVDAEKKPALALADSIFKLRKSRFPLNESDLKKDEELANQLLNLRKCSDTCLGLTPEKMSTVLEDWNILLDAISATGGDRTLLKRNLLNIEQNPSRGIARILRLLTEAAQTSGAPGLIKHMSPTSVESVLVGMLGPQEFQSFCEQFATVVKLDYALDFFKGLVCACIRKERDGKYKMDSDLSILEGAKWNKLGTEEKSEINNWENDRTAEITNRITILFIKVLSSLINRYWGVIGQASVNPRRFGFQLRDLTKDEKVRNAILDLLCIQNSKDYIGLTWIADEVTIWSFD
jgi:hypothetical protein